MSGTGKYVRHDQKLGDIKLENRFSDDELRVGLSAAIDNLKHSNRESIKLGFNEFESGANKDLQGKLRFDLIPAEVEQALAEVLTFGASKYADRNWEKGIPLMALYGAARRHMHNFKKGIDLDDESGLHHLKHALTDLAFMITFIERNRTDLDDRP